MSQQGNDRQGKAALTLGCQHLRRGSQPPTLLQGVRMLHALRRRLSDGGSGVGRGQRQVRLLLRRRLPLLRRQQLPGRRLEQRCVLPADQRLPQTTSNLP